MTLTTFFKTTLITLFFSLLSFQALAQKDTEFWFVAPEISQNNASNFDNPVAFRFSTYSAPAVVKISQPANPAFPIQTLNIAANSSGVLQLPPLFQFVENTPANTVLNKGFLIESTSPITAYYEVIGTSPNDPELFSLKGKNALGTTFYTPFQNVTDNSNGYTPLPHAAFDIVATEDNTMVTITPTRAIVGHAANIPFNITLNRGQTYSGDAQGQLAAQHPSGSKIVSTKPVAVTIKDDLLEGAPLYGGFCRDLMGDQMVPIEKLGTRYVVQKGLLNGNEFAFVVATQNATQVKLDGVVAGVINTGQQINLSITAGAHFIESSAPVYVLQMTGNNCELAGEILPALDCSGSNSVRFVRSTDEPFYLFLTTRNGFEGGFLLNGNAGLIQASDFQVVPGSSGEFVAATIPFSNAEVQAGLSSVVSNSQGLFQLGILNGNGSGTGCRFGYFSDFGNKVVLESNVALCPNETIEIEGQHYFAPATVSINHPGLNGACDTVAVYELALKQEVLVSQDIPLCPGQTISLGGQSFTAPATINLTLPGSGNACDTLATYHLILKPQVAINENIALCPGETISLGGQNHSAPATVNVTYPGVGNACDTLATYHLILKPQVSINENIGLCLGETVFLGGQNHSAPATVNVTYPGVGNACDTLATYHLILKPQVAINENIGLCPGETISLGGQNHSAPATVNVTYPGVGNACDTLATYHLILKPQVAINENIGLCPGETISLGGQNHSAPATVNVTYPGVGDACDTLATYHLILKPQVSINENIGLCPGETISLGGQIHSAPATVNVTYPGVGDACDTLATYHLILKPQVSINENIGLCPGETISLGGQNHSAPATVNVTYPGVGNACDTLATYHLILKPQVSINENIGLCPGETVSLGGQNHSAPATVNVTYPGVGNACDTLATYHLILKPQPSFSQIIEFCPGETITLGGIGYTHPTTVVLTLPATVGCDTIATYTLKYLTPAPSNVSIVCPANISVITPPGTGPIVVTYSNPVAASDCPCPGIRLNLTAGLPSGSLFPPTSTQVCWRAADSCGQTATCCFVVTVREELPCDVKTIGCMKYELLNITADAEKNRTYRIRVTNFCANKLTYTAIQVPNGLIAMSPADNSIYTAPTSGRKYLVRSPNYSPTYSVRFKSTTDSISNGEFDVLRYTLPAQADVTFIHIVSRLEPQVYYEAHLNTFNCPIGVTPPGGGKQGAERMEFELKPEGIMLFPNPTSGALFADLSAWAGQELNLRILDSRGQTVLQRSVSASTEYQSLGLPETLPNGLYFLEIITHEGERKMAQFVRVGE